MVFCRCYLLAVAIENKIHALTISSYFNTTTQSFCFIIYILINQISQTISKAKYIAKYLVRTVNFKWSNTVCRVPNSLVYTYTFKFRPLTGETIYFLPTRTTTQQFSVLTQNKEV